MAGPGGQEVGRISIRVVPNTDGFRRQLKKELEEAEAGLQGEIEFKAEFDENGIRAKAKATAAALDQKIQFEGNLDLKKAVAAVNSLDKTAKFNLQLDDKFDYRLRQRIAKIKPKVKVDVDVDEKSVARASGRMASMFKKFNALPSFGSGVNPAGFALIGVGLMTVLAPVIGLLTTSLLAIPGLISLIAAPIAAITLGLDGFKKAAQVLEGPLIDLKAAMSARVQDQFTPVFETLGRVFPTLKASLPTVSQGLADMAQSIANVITSPENLTKLDDTIRNIGTSLTAAAPGIGSFTQGFLDLANSLSKQFPDLSTWFNGAGKSFTDWVKEITSPAGGIGNALSGKSPLDNAFEGLGTNLKVILDTLGSIAQEGFEWAQNPEKVQAFADAVGRIGDAMQSIVNASDKFLGVLDKIENSKLNRSIEDDGWAKTIERAFDDQPDNLGQGWFEQLVGGSRPAEAGDSWIEQFWAKFHDGGDAFSRGLDTVKGLDEWVKNPLGKLGDLFGVGLPQAAADTGQQTGQQFNAGVQKGMAGGLGQSATTKLVDPAAVTAQVQPAIQGIQTQIAALAPAIQGAMAQVVQAATAGAQQVVAAFTSAFAPLPAQAAGIFNQLGVAAQGGMIQVVAVIQAGAQQSVAAVQAMGQQIISALQAAAAGAQAAGAQVGAGMAAGIRGSIPGAVAAASELAAAVEAAAKTSLGIKSPSKVFEGIGWNTTQGLADGIDSGSGSVVDRAKALADQISEAMSGGLEGLSTGTSDQIKQMIAELELQRKELKVQKNGTEDKGQRQALTDQMDSITALKDQLSLQKDQLGYADKYGSSLDSHQESIEQANSMVAESIAGMLDLAKGFVSANANQFMSDLGMSGKGAIPTIANIGLDWASGLLSKAMTGGMGMGGNTIFQVNSVDDAVAGAQRVTAKKALQYHRR